MRLSSFFSFVGRSLRTLYWGILGLGVIVLFTEFLHRNSALSSAAYALAALGGVHGVVLITPVAFAWLFHKPCLRAALMGTAWLATATLLFYIAQLL